MEKGGEEEVVVVVEERRDEEVGMVEMPSMVYAL